MFKFKRMNKMK